MKKIILIIMLIASMLTLTSTVSAAEVTYKNLVTDDTTIEEDFKLLGMDINEYYIPKTYNYQKWYVVAMSESYNADKTIQTYFYLYNPTIYWYQPELTLTYVINGVQKNFVCSDFLEVDNSRGLHKIKGFLYDYCKDVKICINNIKHFYENDQDDINSGFVETYLFNSISTFEANNEHSLASQSISMDLNFDSTIIVEKYNVVEVNVEPDKTIWNSIYYAFQSSTIFGGEIEKARLYFYNFDFPDRVKPEVINSATFSYDTIKYHRTRTGEIEVLESESNQLHIIEPKTHEVKSGLFSATMNFETFYLGNRIKDNQFGDVDFTEEDKALFNYDCSILLEVFPIEIAYHTQMHELGIMVTTSEEWYTEIDDVNFLEIDYDQDGINYVCQVISPPVGQDEFDKVEVEPGSSLLDKFIKWFKDNFPKSLIIIVVIAVAIIALCAFAPHLVFGALKGIISLIVYIFTLPIKLIKLIFKRE